jgi:hypothetical protein
MEPFMKSHQYNFIKAQTKIVLNGYATSSDRNVRSALRDMAKEKVFKQFAGLSEEQRELLNTICSIENKGQRDEFLSQLEPCVIPFQPGTEQTIKKLFPKAKKLKVPLLEMIDMKELTYLSWDEKGSDKRYIVAYHHENLVGLQGTFTAVHKKGLCSLCNRIEEIGMFVLEVKGSAEGTYLKRGNYICQDSQKCNQNITTLDKLHDFIEHLKK